MKTDNLTDLEKKVLNYMVTEKAHYVQPKDLDFLSDRGVYKVMSNLEKKGYILRRVSTHDGIPYFEGYSITNKIIDKCHEK